MAWLLTLLGVLLFSWVAVAMFRYSGGKALGWNPERLRWPDVWGSLALTTALGLAALL